MRANRSVAAILIVLSSVLALASTTIAIPLDWYDYVIHDPIEIDSNGDFVNSTGVTGGSGTPDDPYVISTWDILPPSSMSVPTAIRISNTTVCVLIEYVHVQHSRYGIFLHNATNVTVMSCLVTRNEFGVNLEQCESCQVMNCSLAFNERAIRVFECSNMVIWNNGFQDNSAIMVYGEPVSIVWWVIILAVSLAAVLVVLLYLMRTNFAARRKPAYRIGSRLAAIGLIQVLEFYQIAPFLERSFGNGGISWNSYVFWTGIAALVGVVCTVFALIFKTKWTESRLP